MHVLFRFMYFRIAVWRSTWRVLVLKCLYPNIQIDWGTSIGPGCSIVCVKGSQMTIQRCAISAGTHIIADAGAVVEIRESFIGRNCVITAKEKVVIDAGCLLAEMVVVRDQNHATDEHSGALTAFTSAPIHIQAGTWIAAKATVLQGVQIGTRAIVGAHAVVTKSIPAGETWVGIPAKPIRSLQASS